MNEKRDRITEVAYLVSHLGARVYVEAHVVVHQRGRVMGRRLHPLNLPQGGQFAQLKTVGHIGVVKDVCTERCKKINVWKKNKA